MSYKSKTCKSSKGEPLTIYESKHETKEAAKTRAKILMKEKGSVPLYVYKCEYSEGWHLTHKSCDSYN